MSYRRRTSMSYMLWRKWNPPRYGLCPKCERELMEELKKKGIKPPLREPPKGEPPEWTEIKPRGRSGGSGSGGQKGQQKGQGKDKDEEIQQGGKDERRGEGKGKEGQDEKGKAGKPGEEKRGGKGRGRGAGKGGKEESGPLDVSPEDIEKARKGSEDVNEEFEKAQQIKVDKTTPMFKPIIGAGPASSYRDQAFIQKMRTAMKDWKTGYVETPQKYGTKLKVKQYIKTKGKYPFVTRIRKSAKGRKILFVADFSGSVEPFQEQYKKALVSALEVLDSIGVKTALFGFGGEPGPKFFFKIKKFEDPKWTLNHASKVAALQGSGLTPTAEAYMGLENYIKMHRPDMVVTLTDGEPNREEATKQMIKRLRRYTKMVAFGIGDPTNVHLMEHKLKALGYDKTFAVSTSQMSKLPKKLVDLMAPT